MTPMRITRIDVCDFRAFPGPGVYSFEFGPARNLFIYGENGSGKSSLFRAIQEFFRRGNTPFSQFKNVDSLAVDQGHIAVHYDNGKSQSWPYSGSRPLAAPPTSQTALQVGCFDYRSLLETNFSQKGDKVDIFSIAVNHLLPNLEVPVRGGTRSIGALWKDVRKPKGHYRSYLERCHEAVERFNNGFEPVIRPLIDKASELLQRFPGAGVSLSASFRRVEYSKTLRGFENQELFLQVHRNGALLNKHHDFLNEARLSAIALVIYLAGLLISVPAVSAYPKLLVLDDVLIGLDMENRQPVLDILAEFFPDWQIILLTHDKVWYEMVQVDLTSSGVVWKAYEMWPGPDHRPCCRPRAGGDEFFLKVADQHLADHDHHAAANYARLGLEAKLKAYCDRKSVPVPYKKEARHMTSESFWKAAKEHSLAKSKNNATETENLNAMFHAVDVAKRVVLNPLSHQSATTVTQAEIQAGIRAVRNLRFDLRKVDTSD